MSPTLQDLASRFGLELHGDGSTVVEGICNLVPGKPGHLTFLANPKFRSQLGSTLASAVVVAPRDVAALNCPGLVAKDPYLAFARVAVVFDRGRDFQPGIHPFSAIAASAKVGEGVHVGPHCHIDENAEIGSGCYIGAGSVVGRGARIGSGSRLIGRAHVGDRVRLGERCLLQPGAVVGSRGFGNARGPSGWEEVPQLGTVVVGDDVEIGANTCIDRGAIDDTVIGNGVKLDNLIQIAHNCHIGEHTAIAAGTAIAGSTRIGARCMIGGAVAIAGHLHIGDDVVVLGRAMVTHSLIERGVYGSGLPVAPAREWRRTVARIRRLDRLEQRLKNVEGRLAIEAQEDGEDEQDEL